MPATARRHSGVPTESALQKGHLWTLFGLAETSCAVATRKWGQIVHKLSPSMVCNVAWAESQTAQIYETKTCRICCDVLKEWERRGWQEREREIAVYPKVSFPNARKRQRWVRPKLGPRNSFWAGHVEGRSAAAWLLTCWVPRCTPAWSRGPCSGAREPARSLWCKVQES